MPLPWWCAADCVPAIWRAPMEGVLTRGTLPLPPLRPILPAQADLPDDREVSDDDALAFARTRGMIYLEASAKTRAGIRQAFEEVSRHCDRKARVGLLSCGCWLCARYRPMSGAFQPCGALTFTLWRFPASWCMACRWCAGRATDPGHTRAARGHARRRRRCWWYQQGTGRCR